MPIDLARALGKLVIARIKAGHSVLKDDRKMIAHALKSSHEEADRRLIDKLDELN